MNNYKSKLLLTALFFTFSVSFSFSQTVHSLANETIGAMGKVNTLKYRMSKQERFKGKMLKGELQVKYQKSPFKVYIYMYEPKAGIEILYASGENSGKANVNPGNFLNVFAPTLDPMSKTIRKEDHHTIFETGFEYTRNLLVNLKKRAEEEGGLDKFCTYDGEVEFAGRKCYKLTLDYPEFKWVDYKVEKGEDVLKIAQKNNLYEYIILEKNNLSWYDKVSEGNIIKVPNIYAKKVIIYIDKINKLPIYQEVHDDKGLLAIYEYHRLIINPTLAENDFDKKNPEYKFK